MAGTIAGLLFRLQHEIVDALAGLLLLSYSGVGHYQKHSKGSEADGFPPKRQVHTSCLRRRTFLLL